MQRFVLKSILYSMSSGFNSILGDGGSPLVCPVQGKPGHFYQAGIVAWGIGCGEQGTPGAYVVRRLQNNHRLT
jgi:secreted trypsin-like serine protease